MPFLNSFNASEVILFHKIKKRHVSNLSLDVRVEKYFSMLFYLCFHLFVFPVMCQVIVSLQNVAPINML